MATSTTSQPYTADQPENSTTIEDANIGSKVWPTRNRIASSAQNSNQLSSKLIVSRLILSSWRLARVFFVPLVQWPSSNLVRA